MNNVFDFSKKEMEEYRDALIGEYEALSIEQIKLAKLISSIDRKSESSPKELFSGFYKASYTKGILAIEIDKIPEEIGVFFKKGSAYYNEVKNFWQSTIISALEHYSIEEFAKPAFVLIEIYKKGEFWDIDNRNVKFIIDAIRYAGVIKDDTYKEIAYSVLGHKSEFNKTIITVSDRLKHVELLTKL